MAKKIDPYFQNVNFHFAVDLGKEANSEDVRFQSVSGLDSTLETETIKEGGVNGFEHVVPVRRKYGPLILKRGVMIPSKSGITKWLKQVFDHEKVEPIPIVTIRLLDEEQQPIMFWQLENVWPRSWKMGDLDAMRGEVLIETLELNYNRLILT